MAFDFSRLNKIPKSDLYEDEIFGEKKKKENQQNNATQLGYDNSESKNTWFNHNNLFDDGYQLGDVTRTALGSAVDVFSNLVHGVSNLGEGLSDSILYGIANVQNKKGNTEYANRIRTNASKSDWDDDSNIIGKAVDKYTNKESILGDKIDQVNQGIGYSAMLGAIGSLPGGSVLSNATTLISATGSGESQAYNEQYQNALNNSFNGSMEDYLNSNEGKQTVQNARLYGLLSGATETATENMAGGLGNLFNKATGKATKTLGVTAGFGDLDDKIAKGLANKFKSQVAKNLVEFGVKAGGEGSEEVVGGLADALWQKITYKKGEKYWNLVKDQNIPESALSATISSAIMQSPQFIQTTKAGRDFITNMTPQEEDSYNVILSNKQKQLMKDKTINNEIDTKYKDLTDEEKAQKYQELSTEYDNYDIKPTKLTRDEIEQTENEAYQEMYNQINNQTYNRKQADEQNLLNNEQQNTNSVNDFQVNSNSDDYNSTIAYQYQKSDNEKIDQLRQDIANNTNWNNSNKTHGYVNMLEKLITDKDIEIRIDPNLQDEQGRVANGSYKNGVITINPNSDRSGEFLAVHELTHAIGTQDMINIVKKYMDNNKEFKANVQSLLKTYNKSEIDEEALADVSGQLFGNQEFINNVAQTKPNVFKRIYNEIKYLYHQFTGYKNQDQFVNDLYNKWTEAYNSNNELNTINRYSIQEDNDGNKYIKVDTDQDIFDGIKTKDYSKIAKMYMQDYLMGKTNLSDNDVVSIGNKGVNKYTNPKQNTYYMSEKMKLTPELKNALRVARKDSIALPTKDTSKYPNWEYYKFRFELSGRNFEGTINIGVDKNGNKHFYEINKIRAINSHISANTYNSTNLSNASIAPKEIGVNTNTKYSMQESENNSGSFNLPKTLLAQHNTSEEKLKEALNLGALPVPSIAITKGDTPISNYGDITLLFDKDTINPTDKRNVAYNSDIYSTRKPQIVNSLDKAKVKLFENYAKEQGISRGYLDIIEQGIEENNDTSVKSAIEMSLRRNNNDTSKENIENLLGKAKEMIGEKRIYKEGVDPYNERTGTKKTIKQMSTPYSLDNIVKYMTSKGIKGAESNWYAGLPETRANMSSKFNDISEMHDQESNLISSAKMENIKEDLNNQYDKILTNLEKYDTEKDTYTSSYDKVANAINETAKDKKVDVNTLADNLSYVGVKNIPKEDLNNTINFLNSLRNAPTEYFESKPQRAVGFDEVKKAIVPENTSKEIINKLKEKGIKIETYTDEQDRINKIKDTTDIRFSKENQPWREYLEKNFKSEGTTTKFSDLAIDNKQQKQEILNKAKQVEQINPDFKGLSDDIKNNYLNNKDIKLDDINEYLDNILNENNKKSQKSQENSDNSILRETTYKEDAQRKKDYMKFKNDNTAYKTEEVNNALMSVQANRNGKRTVNQWKEVANQIGQQLAINNRNENYVQRIAFKSWFDLQPNTKESITRYDNKTKQNQSFQKFTSDDWVNTIYKSYKEQMRNINTNIDSNIQENKETQKVQNKGSAKQVENINTPGEMVDYSQMERPPEGKQRKFYKSIIESSNTTAEAKKISKELMGYDTYVPTSNAKNLQKADTNINTNGTENSLIALSTKVNNNEKIDASDVATGERLIEYYSKIGDKEHLQEAIQTTALAGTQAGQAVQAFALLNRMTPQGQVTYIQRSINKINKKLEDKYNKSLFKGNRELQQFNFTPEMQQEILNADGKAELESAIDDVYRQLGQQVSKSATEKIDAWRYFSMLGNPRTHIRNIIGNKAMEGLQGIKNKVAGAIEDAVLGNQDVEHTHTLRRASKETIAFAKNDINNVKLELGLEDNKYNSQSMISKYQNTFENKTLQKTFGKLMDFNDTMLEKEDGWGLKSNYVKSLSNYLTANNIDVNNISDKQLQKARNFAIKEAQESTFHQDCYLASALNTLENKNLAYKIGIGAVLPFKKTPMNITKTALEYNPIGLAKTITYDGIQLRKGNITVNQYIDNMSKGLTGTGVALLGFALAQSGIIKASGGDDDKKEDFEEGQGKQSYSITIGNHTYSLDWLAPTGIPLFVGAELYSLANQKAGGTEEKGASANQLFKSATNILNAGATSANPLSEMSMISGLTSALQSYGKDNKALENMFLNAGKSYINQFVPTSLGQVAKTLDTKERSTTSTASDPLAKNVDSLANQVKSKIPGLRETLPTKTDTWGNEVNQEGNVTQRFWNNAIAPWNTRQVTTNETDSKLSKLYDETGNSSVLPKNSINKTLTIDKQKYRLSNDEYSRLKKMYGETNYNILSDLMKSESFQSLDNDQKSKAVEKVYSYSQALVKSQYADMNDINTEDAKIVQKVQNIARWGGKASDYFNFSGGSTDEETSDEKATRLKNMDISNKSKEAIYHYDFGQKDKNFSSISKIGVDIDDYLDFKSQKFKNSEDYSSKEQYMDYLDEANMPLNDKELLFSTKYTLNESQKDELFDYIDNSSLSKADKLELFKNLKGFKVLENGNISY